jgi:hypothetical protein
VWKNNPTFLRQKWNSTINRTIVPLFHVFPNFSQETIVIRLYIRDTIEKSFLIAGTTYAQCTRYSETLVRSYVAVLFVKTLYLFLVPHS